MAVRASDQVTLAVVASPTYVRLYYLKQASTLSPPAKPTANPPASPWSTTEPTYSPGSTDTLYTVMLTAYGSSSFEYGDVQKSSSFEAAKQAYNKANNSVASTRTEYAIGNNHISAPTTGWGTNLPNRQEGEVLWFRVVTITAAGAEFNGTPAPVTGDKGLSVSAITPYFQLAKNYAPDITVPGAKIEIARNYFSNSMLAINRYFNSYEPGSTRSFDNGEMTLESTSVNSGLGLVAMAFPIDVGDGATVSVSIERKEIDDYRSYCAINGYEDGSGVTWEQSGTRRTEYLEDGWTRQIWEGYKLPSNANRVGVQILRSQGSYAGAQIKIRKIVVQKSPKLVVDSFFGGTISDDPDFTSEWAGAENNSESVLYGHRQASWGAGSLTIPVTSQINGVAAIRLISILTTGTGWSYTYRTGLPEPLRAGHTFLGKVTTLEDVSPTVKPSYDRVYFAQAPRKNTTRPPFSAGTHNVPCYIPKITSAFGFGLGHGGEVGDPDVWWSDLGLYEGDLTTPTVKNPPGWTTSQPTYPNNGEPYDILTTERVDYDNGTFTWTPVTKVPLVTGPRGKDGLPGNEGLGIKSTEITYSKSTSSTTAPTTGWGPTPPTAVKGQYLWIKMVWTYTDDSVETGYSTSYWAKDGTDGDDGAPGIGITNTAVTYAQHTSGTTAPTSGWGANPPTPIVGRYVWTKIVWTYTNGTTGTSYSVGKIGETGSDGRGIVSATVTYQSGTSATSAPTGIWVANPPTVAAGNFLWTRTITTYTSGSDTTSYSVARQGANGNPGSAGVGVSTSVVTYQSGTSGTTPPTGTWVANPPTVAAGNFLWTRTIITYTNSTTSTLYSAAKQGEKGNPGDQGISITKVTPYYRLSATALSTPTVKEPSGWVTTEPAYVVGMSLYISDRIDLSNGTFQWTAVRKSSSYTASSEANAKADNALHIGNLAKDIAEGKVWIGPTEPPLAKRVEGQIWIKTESVIPEVPSNNWWKDTPPSAVDNIPIEKLGNVSITRVNGGVSFTTINAIPTNTSLVRTHSSSQIELSAGDWCRWVVPMSNVNSYDVDVRLTAAWEGGSKSLEQTIPANSDGTIRIDTPKMTQNVTDMRLSWRHVTAETIPIGTTMVFKDGVGPFVNPDPEDRMVGVYHLQNHTAPTAVWDIYTLVTGMIIVPGDDGTPTIIDQNGAYIGKISAESISAESMAADSVGAKQVIVGSIDRGKLDPVTGEIIDDSESLLERVVIGQGTITISRSKMSTGGTPTTGMQLDASRMSFFVQNEVAAYIDSEAGIMNISKGVFEDTVVVGEHEISRLGENNITIFRWIGS